MAKLLIVESPGKLKTLRQILGRDWILEASVGHTTELASDGHHRLGFDLHASRVETRYVPRGDRGQQVLAQLRRAVKNADRVYLATDPDREGEAIAWHLVEQLKLKNYCRVSYTQITEAAVRRAVDNPGIIDRALVESQRARQCLDKLVGFEVSPLLWNSTGGKSAGRVQSATLHLVCERERERLAFRPEKYWKLQAHYGEGFSAQYEPTVAAIPSAPVAGGVVTLAPAPQNVRSAEEAARIEKIARTHPHVLGAHEAKTEMRFPPPPFITSSLQQMAGARFKFSPKKTMQLAQELYEGVNGKGLITYMRTDSISLSPEFAAEAAQWIKENSPDSAPAQPPEYRARGAAQAAHEAIRPTSAFTTPEKVAGQLTPDQRKIYTLIWERTIASQCRPANLSRTKLTIDCADTRWIARGMTVVDPGYLKFWKNTEDEKTLPSLRAGQMLVLRDVKVEARSTEPPSRFTEPKLVQLMEKRGIGRPSTYASTLTTLKDREYVGLEKDFIVPTALGMNTDETLGRALPDLVNPEFTATMESALDAIAENRLGWERYLIDWNRDYLEPALANARQMLGISPHAANWTPSKAMASLSPALSPAPSRAVPARDAPIGSPENPGLKKRRDGATPGRPAPPARARTCTPAPRKSRAPKKSSGADLEKLTLAARKSRTLPICPEGHGELTLQLSSKQAPYWRCGKAGCESFAWYQELAKERCPECHSPLEKIPSKKVTGGYFLKCKRTEHHPSEVVLFRNRQSKAWERAETKG